MSNNIMFFCLGYMSCCFVLTILQEIKKYKNKEK